LGGRGCRPVTCRGRRRGVSGPRSGPCCPLSPETHRIVIARRLCGQPHPRCCCAERCCSAAALLSSPGRSAAANRQLPAHVRAERSEKRRREQGACRRRSRRRPCTALSLGVTAAPSTSSSIVEPHPFPKNLFSFCTPFLSPLPPPSVSSEVPLSEPFVSLTEPLLSPRCACRRPLPGASASTFDGLPRARQSTPSLTPLTAVEPGRRTPISAMGYPRILQHLFGG